MTSVDICICTYRRTSLLETLDSIAGMDVPQDVDMSVIVIDNDAAPSAKERVEEAARNTPYPLRYVHCPKNNISIARNGGLQHSTAQLIAFVDDDEMVSPGWLRALYDMYRMSDAAIVLGPVEPRYEPHSPNWMRKSAPHRTRPVWKNGEIRTGYTCNALIDREHPSLDGLGFEERLGKTGGEDTVFFATAHERGARIAYAPDAVVTEPVPEDRAQFGWLARRRFRMGQTHADLLRSRAEGSSVASAVATALGKAVVCGVSAIGAIASPSGRNEAVLRGVLHLGVVAGLLGGRTIPIYGDAARGQINGGTAR